MTFLQNASFARVERELGGADCSGRARSNARRARDKTGGPRDEVARSSKVLRDAGRRLRRRYKREKIAR
jgi:hypothetical protein